MKNHMKEPQELKLCKDCKYFYRSWTDIILGQDRKYAKCSRTLIVNQDPITGVFKRDSRYCSMERNKQLSE